MAKTKKRNMQSALLTAAKGAAFRGGGSLAGAAIAHTVIPKMTASKPENILNKQKGAVIAVAGIVAEAFLPDENLQKVAQGLSSYGVVQMANDNIPESMKGSIRLENDGLSGIGATEVSVDWNRLAEEAENAAMQEVSGGVGFLKKQVLNTVQKATSAASTAKPANGNCCCPVSGIGELEESTAEAWS